MSWVAFIDESGSNSQKDPGTYIMAAGLVLEEEVDALRAVMAELRSPGQAKLHWRDESGRRRRLITEAIAVTKIEHLVVVTSDHRDTSRPARRRHLTLEVLLPELAALGVQQAIMESRGRHDDARDLDSLNLMRGTGFAVDGLRLHHRRGRHEPNLWVPDAVCGIVSANRCGDSSLYSIIQHKVTALEIPAR